MNGIHNPAIGLSPSDMKTPVQNPMSTVGGPRAIQPLSTRVDDYKSEGVDPVASRILELERSIGLSGSVWRDWTAVGRSSLSIPNIGNPFVRQHTLNQERLRLLHYITELRNLPDGEETILNIWVGLYAGVISSVDPDILNPFPSSTPVFLNLRRVGNEFELLDADTSLMSGSPEHARVWFEIAALKKVHIKPFEDDNGKMSASEIRTIRRYNQSQLEHRLYFHSQLRRLIDRGENECDVWVDPHTAMVRELTVGGESNVFSDLIRLRLYLELDSNGFMGYYLDVSGLSGLKNRAKQVDLIRSFVRVGNIITFEPPPEYEIMQASLKTSGADAESRDRSDVDKQRMVEGFITESSVSTPPLKDGRIAREITSESLTFDRVDRMQTRGSSGLSHFPVSSTLNGAYKSRIK